MLKAKLNTKNTSKQQLGSSAVVWLSFFGVQLDSLLISVPSEIVNGVIIVGAYCRQMVKYHV